MVPRNKKDLYKKKVALKSLFAGSTLGLGIMIASQLVVLPKPAIAFPNVVMRRERLSLNVHQAVANQDDEITKQVERAKALLEKSKAKMQAKEQELEATSPKNGAKIPFFASKEKSNGNKKEKVTKTENEEGLITTDGEMMAKLSEAEEWEVRGLLDVFENEQKDSTPDPFADRDVAGSIFNLRKTLQTEDFQKIFDKRNRFIGEN